VASTGTAIEVLGSVIRAFGGDSGDDRIYDVKRDVGRRESDAHF
jgi:hypothetical protein